MLTSTHKIRSTPRTTPVILMGCSSGRLPLFGEYECAGTVYEYLLSGW